MNARRQNAELPSGVAINKTGEFTTDPQETAALFPLGGEVYGYKGYGLALMIDILCGPLNGMPFGPAIPTMYGDLSQRRHLGSLMLAIDPSRFAGGISLPETIQQITESIKQQPGEIYFPGEPEYLCEVQRKINGIYIDPELLEEMNTWSSKLNQMKIRTTFI